jgi:hypothetical protein
VRHPRDIGPSRRGFPIHAGRPSLLLGDLRPGLRTHPPARARLIGEVQQSSRPENAVTFVFAALKPIDKLLDHRKADASLEVSVRPRGANR